MRKIIPFLLLFAACNSGQKKILVISKGDITVYQNNITIEDGNNYAEQEINLKDGDNTTLKVTGPTGNFSVDVPKSGYYILSVRKDTLLGSYQRIGTDLNGPEMTMDELTLKIDSLRRLMAGTNISAVHRNFFITPNQLQKITDNTSAQIVGPFKLIPNSFNTVNGKEPEIYKFFTSAEMRDMIDKLTKLAKGEK
jgi:hypothetical protein